MSRAHAIIEGGCTHPGPMFRKRPQGAKRLRAFAWLKARFGRRSKLYQKLRRRTGMP
jgi:hypothetical protein